MAVNLSGWGMCECVLVGTCTTWCVCVCASTLILMIFFLSLAVNHSRKKLFALKIFCVISSALSWRSGGCWCLLDAHTLSRKARLLDLFKLWCWCSLNFMLHSCLGNTSPLFLMPSYIKLYGSVSCYKWDLGILFIGWCVKSKVSICVCLVQSSRWTATRSPGIVKVDAHPCMQK